jgi:hypothetical protein
MIYCENNSAYKSAIKDGDCLKTTTRMFVIPACSWRESNHYTLYSNEKAGSRISSAPVLIPSKNLIKISIHSLNIFRLSLMDSRQKHAGMTNALVLLVKNIFQ